MKKRRNKLCLPAACLTAVRAGREHYNKNVTDITYPAQTLLRELRDPDRDLINCCIRDQSEILHFVQNRPSSPEQSEGRTYPALIFAIGLVGVNGGINHLNFNPSVFRKLVLGFPPQSFYKSVAGSRLVS